MIASDVSSSSDPLHVQPIRLALLSVSDKTNLIEFARSLVAHKVQILSTGGTAQALRSAGVPVKDVSEHTGFPEMMDGRVKTLHPRIHGGLLQIRGKAEHDAAAAQHQIPPIDLVVSNLYPFESTVAKGADFETCVENVDIGGPAMVRSAAKNHRFVTVVTDVSQYAAVTQELAQHGGGTTLALRRRLAAEAFRRTAVYDTAIAQWFAARTAEPPAAAQSAAESAPTEVTRRYTRQFELKYGANPHETPAAIYSLADGSLPLRVLHGRPGYINLLDAANAAQLVAELRAALRLPAAASFKHVSPAGAAVAVPIPDALADVYELPPGRRATLSAAAVAYVRARQADPLCSFGDFVALSDAVDDATAEVLKSEVSDGCIAPGYSAGALRILQAKKNGAYVVLQSDPGYVAPRFEMREVYGVGFYRRRNEADLSAPEYLRNAVTRRRELPPEARRDLVLACITMKYTQSNSVGYAKDGQMIGIGAGQQSRVDCVKLAGRKAETWHLRGHPRVRALRFRAAVKKTERVNARVRFIEGDFTGPERVEFEKLFEPDAVPAPLTAEEKAEYLKTLAGVSLSSDAFFPFRDSIDQCSKRGVQYVVQPGGSVQDDEVIRAADEYGMAMVFTGVRLFHH